MVLFVASAALAATINCPQTGECNGTNDDDTIHGTDWANTIYAKDGSDRPVYGHGGYDDIHLSAGYDTARAGYGGDHVWGGENGDFGPDRLIGGPQVDYLEDHIGLSPFANTSEFDLVCGDDGDDELHIDDNNVVDYWNGGGGSDFVHRETNDEHVDTATCHG